MNNINTFKNYATSGLVPSYFREYVEGLDDNQLNWFYHQVKDALEFLTTEAYLIYKFKWIKDNSFNDLSKEIYLHSLYNPELFTFDIIKLEWEQILDEKYKDDEDVRRYYKQIL